MKTDLGHYVIVTGAARGLGLAVSQNLVESGFQVLGIGRNESEEFASLGSNVSFERFDLLELESIPGLVRQVVASRGFPPFGLVNNSGVGNDGILATQHDSQIEEVLRLNLHAPILLSKYFGRQMIRQREGRIVNISSIIASTGFRGLAVYGASKAGLEGFTRSFAREMGSAGVTVNCVAPGYMKTAMTEKLNGAKLESVIRRAPLGLPSTSDAAGAVAYLLGNAGAKVTGSVVTVDGGATA